MEKKNIGLLLAMLENEYSTVILEGAIKAADECNANVIVFPMDVIDADFSDKETTNFRYQYNTLSSFLNCPGIDGWIVEFGTITSYLTEEQKLEFLSNVNKENTVLIAGDNPDYINVYADNNEGIYELTKHLIKHHKYKNIACMSGPKGNVGADERLNAFRTSMEKYGCPLKEDWIMYGNFSIYIEDLVTDFLTKHPETEVIACANDGMAMGAISASKKMGRIPGKDIFVTGFDNIVESYLYTPSITTVDANPFSLSYAAVMKLCGKAKMETEAISTSLLKRESCGCTTCRKDSYWKEKLNISQSWKNIAVDKIVHERERRDIEHELGNITRELVFYKDLPAEKNKALLGSLSKMGFKSGTVYLYENFVLHNKDEKWILPEQLISIGYLNDYTQREIYSPVNSHIIAMQDMFGDIKSINEDYNHLVILPLFYAEFQIGLLVVESDPGKFVHAFDIAKQISNTLYILKMNDDQKQLEKELKSANEAKSKFLANMSHEIRTPINAIIGLNEMVLRESTENEIVEYAYDIKNASSTLLSLVSDILDFSKIEAGKLEIMCNDYNFDDMIKNVVGMTISRAQEKGLSVKINVKGDFPRNLNGDSRRIEQVLLNLLSNATKYTNKGTITLNVAGREVNGAVNLFFSVIDTGIGIKNEDKERLLKEFERLEEDKHINVEGTGLGLSITEGLLNLMGSSLRIESEYGKGSVFSFNIRQKITSNLSKSAKDNKENEFIAPGVKILVVDDNAMNRKVMMHLLKNSKAIVDQASSGNECIEMVQEAKYDVILLDHMMPGIDGIETYKIMTEQKMIDTAETIVIALTANAVIGAEEMYKNAGFAEYISKPVRPEVLYSILNNMLKTIK